MQRTTIIVADMRCARRLAQFTGLLRAYRQLLVGSARKWGDLPSDYRARNDEQTHMRPLSTACALLNSGRLFMPLADACICYPGCLRVGRVGAGAMRTGNQAGLNIR